MSGKYQRLERHIVLRYEAGVQVADHIISARNFVWIALHFCSALNLVQPSGNVSGVLRD